MREEPFESGSRYSHNRFIIITLFFLFLFVTHTQRTFSQENCFGEKNKAMPKCVQAIKMFRSASIFVLGRDVTANEIDLLDGYMQQLYKAEFNNGLTFAVAMEICKKRIAGIPAVRIEITNRARYEVFGSDPSPYPSEYDQKIKDGKAWYSTIVADMTSDLNSNRKSTIYSAFLHAIGRAPNESELKVWMADKRTYAKMLKAQTEWLYSPAGAQELTTAIAQALKTRRTQYWKETHEPASYTPDDKEAGEVFKRNRLSYKEMVNYVFFYKP